MLNIDFNRIKSCCLLLFLCQMVLTLPAIVPLSVCTVCLGFAAVFEPIGSGGVGPLVTEVVAVLAFAVGRRDHAIARGGSPRWRDPDCHL